MAFNPRSITEQLIDLDAETQRLLVDIAVRLWPQRDRLGRAWNEANRISSGSASVPDDQATSLTSDLLDLFFDHVAKGDFTGYYRAIMAKGREYQAIELPFGGLMLAVHHFEQAARPSLASAYHKASEHRRAAMAIDQLADNTLVLIASSYFDTTLAELSALHLVTDTALSTLDLDELVHSLLSRMVDAAAADAGFILLQDSETGERRAGCAIGLSLTDNQPLSMTRGFAAQVIALGRSISIDDVPANLPVDEEIRRARIETLLGVPLKLGQSIVGVVCVGRLGMRPFAAREIRLLELLAERAAAALDHADLFQHTTRLLRQTAALQRLSNSISAQMAIEQVLEVVIDGVTEVFGAQCVAIHLYDDQDGSVRCPAARGLSPKFIETVNEAHQSTVGEQFLVTTKPVYIPDAQRDPSPHSLVVAEAAREGIRTILVLPFSHGTEARGGLCLYHEEVRLYDDEERGLAQTFADQTAIAIANATLYRGIRERAAESERLNKELQIVDRMKADFLAMVSHELRTPLTAILGYTDLLLRGARGGLPERQAGDLKTIRTNGQRLLTLINDLIDFSSIEAGHSSLKTDRLRLHGVLAQALQSFIAQAEVRSIELRSELPPDLPEVSAEPAAVEKILSQLLSNALKFTSAGGTVVLSAYESNDLPSRDRVSRPAQCTDTSPCVTGHKVVISITDNGIGIPEEQLARIWDHFYQVDSSSARRFGGAGLGLAIVRRLVELQGGCTWAESAGQPGQGSRFSFALEVARAMPSS